MRRICFLLLAVAACSKSPQPATGDSAAAASAPGAALPPGHAPIPSQTSGEVLTPEAQALVDSGNAAVRAKDHKGALAYYRRASAAVPLHPAPWFGTYMAAQALGDSALADSAQRMIKARAPGMTGHPAAGDGSMKSMSPHGAPTTPPSPRTAPSRKPGSTGTTS